MTSQEAQKDQDPAPYQDSAEHRIGVYVCHCGLNIAGVVDVTGVCEYAATLPGVAVTKDL